MMRVKLSVVIVTRQRPLLLQACLQSLAVAISRLDKEIQVETLVGLNGPDLPSLQILKDFPAVRVLSLRQEPTVHMGLARNEVFPFARGEWILFLDDDVTVAEEYLQKFFALTSRHPEFNVVGGPNLTPKDSSYFQRLQGLCLSHGFGSAFCAKRYFLKKRVLNCDENQLILCNLFVKKECLEQVRFHDDLLCAEENKLLYDLKARNNPMIADPELYVYHERRPSLRLFLRQIQKYGFGRGQNVMLLNFKFFHLIPTLFVAYVAGALFGFLPLFPLVMYLTLSFLVSFKMAYDEKNIKTGFAAMLLFFLIHCYYGIGLVRGILHSFFAKFLSPRQVQIFQP